MKKTNICSLGLHCFIVLALCLTTGCKILFPPKDSEEELNEKRRQLLDTIESQEKEIRQNLQVLTDKHREVWMNMQRLRLEEMELDAMKADYHRHLEKAKEVEEIDRQKLNDHFRYNEIILRNQMPEKGLATAEQAIHSGWTLVVDWNAPVRENCILNGGDFCFNNDDYKGKEAFLVVLTPVVEDQPGVPVPNLPGYSEEEKNADALTASLNAQNFLGITRDYRVPRKGYHRVQKNPEQHQGFYAISGSMRLNRFGNSYQEEVTFISAPLFSYNKVSRISFTPRIAAFAGDYIALLIPADNAIRFMEAKSGDAGDSYYKCSRTVNRLKLQSYAENYCEIIEITREDRIPIQGKRRAAYSLYGDYLMPK